MTTITCDACKKEISDETELLLGKLIFNGGDKFDLCEDCRDRLYAIVMNTEWLEPVADESLGQGGRLPDAAGKSKEAESTHA